MTDHDVVQSARAWIGTPYVHQASVMGAGCDCLGLIRGVWRDAYGQEPQKIPAYSADWSEPQGDEALWRAARLHLLPAPTAKICEGDVLLFRMRRGAVAKHLGIASGPETNMHFIHAYTGHGVVESPLSDPWRNRIVARFIFR